MSSKIFSRILGKALGQLPAGVPAGSAAQPARQGASIHHKSLHSHAPALPSRTGRTFCRVSGSGILLSPLRLTPFIVRSFSTAPAQTGGSRLVPLLGSLGLGFGAYYYWHLNYKNDKPGKEGEEKAGDGGEEEHIANWSATHEVTTKDYHRPESLEELEAVVRDHHEHGRRLRPVGSAISPNGIGLCADGMVNLVLLDKVVRVDRENLRVTVQAGARVQQVVEELRPHGLTLQNFASDIFAALSRKNPKSSQAPKANPNPEVGAHGTGADLPPVDEQVVALKLVTPGKGTLDITPEADPELFYFARLGLGTVGVVAEATLQCVPAHQLVEHTFVTTPQEIRQKHRRWLKEHKHVKYLWIPYTSAVVAVHCDPLPPGQVAPQGGSSVPEGERLRHVRQLFKECAAKYSGGSSPPPPEATAAQPAPGGAPAGAPPPSQGAWTGTAAGQPAGKVHVPSDEEINVLSFTQLRDKLLALDPLNQRHVAAINAAEAQYWALSEGYRVGWSDEILGFDCGGQQWVSEVALPARRAARGLLSPFFGPLQEDLRFMEDVMKFIEEHKIAAPAPIEQRFSRGSRSPLSPVSSGGGGGGGRAGERPDKNELHSWVGIIMYLPTDDEEERRAITRKFFEYKYGTARALWDKYGAHEHWAKIEVPEDEETKTWMKERLRKRFPLDKFDKWRAELDPKNILANDLIDELLPRPHVSQAPVEKK
eukprot:jgi/Mesen1/6550/ME000334S05899